MIVVSSPSRIQVTKTPIKDNESQKVSNTPNWLVASMNRKRSLVPICFPIDDVIRKYTNKAAKPKRTKSITNITFDSTTDRRVAKVATYNQKMVLIS